MLRAALTSAEHQTQGYHGERLQATLKESTFMLWELFSCCVYHEQVSGRSWCLHAHFS